MATSASKEPGHQVPSGSVVAEDAVDPEILAFQEHQRSAARLSLAEEVRTLVAAGGWGVLATNARGDLAGYPGGSVVEYAPTPSGALVFAFSSLSPHTGDLKADPRASFVVTAPGFKGLADARVCLTGDFAVVPEAEVGPLRDVYKARHPGSFWVDFGDFTWFKLEGIRAARVIGGFARAGSVSGEEYSAASPDPIFPFSGPVCGHMNDDHSDSTTAIVKHYTGLTVGSASMLTIDRLGMNVQCSRDGQTFKARVPWVRPAEDRKSIKDVIVEMTRAAAAAAAAAGPTKEEAAAAPAEAK